MNKKEFIAKVKNSCVSIDHLTQRKLDYKYYEYLLFMILIKYEKEEFKVLGLTEDLNITFFPDKNGYSINKRTHVTLNYQLYKLYECGYFKSEDELVEATLKAVRSYNSGVATIKELDNSLRKIRMEFIEEQNRLIY